MHKLRILQFEGLAPSVFCGQYFADLGSDVVIIARHQALPFGVPIHQNMMNRNKKCICLSLKSSNDLEIIKHLIKQTDIVIDSFRPGVLQKLGLGYQDIKKINKGVILLRVSGYGQKGNLSVRPGHDLNYIAVSGFLSKINENRKPAFPNNYLADFVGASLGIIGVMIALRRRESTGEGNQVDCSLMHGVQYLSLFLNGWRGEKGVKIEREGEEESVVYTDQQGKMLKTKIIEMLDLSKNKNPIDFEKQGFISPIPNTNTNALHFLITSPFTSSHPSLSPPTRGQHTLSYLASRQIPSHLLSPLTPKF